MPRPLKWRTVCNTPEHNKFGPIGLEEPLGDPILMTVDEYETLRLMDIEGLTQEECALRMGVARTTIQGIYFSARKKAASAIVESRELKIEGGNYRLCDGQGHDCARRGRRHRNRGQGRGRNIQ